MYETDGTEDIKEKVFHSQKAWKEFVDLNMQSYLFAILFCLAIMGYASPVEDVLIFIQGLTGCLEVFIY